MCTLDLDPEYFLSAWLKKINSLDPKFLSITGDFIDATGVNRSELVSLQKLDCPIFSLSEIMSVMKI